MSTVQQGRQARNRITVVEQVYFQSFGEQPRLQESRYSHELDSFDQPYERRLTAGPDWVPLDIGWVAEPGMILVRNDEGQFFAFNPTEEQKGIVAGRIIELSYGGDQLGWLVPPGETFRGCPSDARALKIRCQRGRAAYTLLVYPH